jgi:hypothetical protein
VTRSKQALVKVWNNLESDYVKQKMANDERDVSVLLACLVAWLVGWASLVGCVCGSAIPLSFD